jgi:acetylornithine deacetylase
MTTLEWLTRLVSFDTTSRNSNLQLIESIQHWLTQHQISSRLTHDAQHNKANLFATIPAHDGNTEGGLILSGHTDVVPIDGQQWDSPPFEATLKDGRVYGRGTSDMKGFIAVVLALVPEFVKLRLNHPIHFAFSYDEEIGCLGAPSMIEDFLAANIKPKGCIVGEPTDMQAIVGHKGIQVFRCRIEGYATHSSLTTQGCNAIEYAAKLICYIREMANGYKEHGPFENTFDIPFTTVSTNMINGGTANNIVPANCEFFFEFRHLPQIKPQTIIANIQGYVQQTLLPEMQMEKSSVKIIIDNLGSIPSFESSNPAAITQFIHALSGDGTSQRVAYATEAGLFQAANIPTIVCGPGNIKQAHRANEYVEVSQLEKCESFLRDIVKFCE